MGEVKSLKNYFGYNSEEEISIPLTKKSSQAHEQEFTASPVTHRFYSNKTLRQFRSQRNCKGKCFHIKPKLAEVL